MARAKETKMTDVVIVAAGRTAIGKFGGTLAKIPAADLGAHGNGRVSFHVADGSHIDGNVLAHHLGDLDRHGSIAALAFLLALLAHVADANPAE